MSDRILVITAKNQKSGKSTVYRIDKKRVTIGSSTSADVRLADPNVNPVHAIIEAIGTDGKPVIYDLASDTGIKVNGNSTVQATVNESDKVNIGDHLLEIKFQSIQDIKAPQSHVIQAAGRKLFLSDKENLQPLISVSPSEVVDIFDHSTESKQSLQVVMFYRDTILDVEHFVDKKRIIIGPRGKLDDFSIPPFFGEGKQGDYELVTKSGDQYTLHLHKNMKGVVHIDGSMTPVSELITGDAKKEITLNQRDFAKVKINDVSFFMNYSPAPPRLKRPKVFQADPFFGKVWFLSLITTALVLYGLTKIVVNPVIEIEQLPERVATILLDPKFMPVEKPKPIPKPVEQPKEEIKVQPPKVPQVIKVTPKPPTTPPTKNPVIGEKQDKPVQQTQTKPQQKTEPKKSPTPVKRASGQEGEGAKAKGPEGSRGNPNAPKADVSQTKAKRPGEGKPSNAAATNKGNSQTNDLGMVDVFKSNQGTLSKVLSGGSGAASAAKNLEGYSGFTTKGAGGLGAEGTQSGGGGESMGLGGLSDKGIGGGKKGTGLGALGSGGNILGGKGKIAIDSGGGAGEPVVLGAIDTDAIARAIAAHRDQIKYCYDKEINAGNAELSGRISIRFVIGASGNVTAAGVHSTSMKNQNVEGCVVDVIRRIPFPPVRGGGVAEVTYPFLFKPTNK